MIKSNDSIACAIFQNADLPVKNSISNFFCEMAGQIHGFFVRKISLLHGRRQEDYINANIHLYNNVQAGDKSVKLLLCCTKT